MSPSEAVWLHSLKLRIVDLVVTANRSINPDLEAVKHLRKHWENVGGTSDNSVMAAVRRYSTRYKNNKISCKEFRGGCCIVLVTEFMLRVHKYHQASQEVVFVDSTTDVDQLNCCLTVMVCPSATGALPLAVLLTSGQSILEYHEAFKLLQETLGKESFFQRGYPSVFMTDNSDAERVALGSIWPDSKQFLCVSRVLQAMWRWLCNAKNEVKLCDRKPLMKIMQRLVYASSKEEFQNELEAMQKNPLGLLYKNVTRYDILFNIFSYIICVCLYS